MSLRLVSFTVLDRSGIRAGALMDDIILDLSAVAECDESPACSPWELSVLSIIEHEHIMDWVVAQVQNLSGQADDAVLKRSQVKLLAPVPNPGKCLCLATNYDSHLNENVSRVLTQGRRELETPRVFMKPVVNTVCGDGDPIYVTPQTRFLDYEGELAIVMGRRARNVKAADALGYVGGVTCCNDISERQLKVWERSKDQDWDKFFDWLNGKWFDNSLPMGPCLVPARFAGDLQNLTLQTRVNGDLRQKTSTGLMLFSIAECIEFISSIMTLEPGDVIATGTPAGVGKTDGRNLEVGDVVEVEISGIGTLTNPVEDQPV